MKQGALATVWLEVQADLHEPDLIWQLAILAGCLLLALLGESLLRRRQAGEGRVAELGRGGLKRISFPVLALILVLLARWVAEGSIRVGLFSLAVPLLASLAVIRAVFYILRVSLVGATWLVPFERVFALLVWGVVALHIVGLLPEVIAVIESVTFNAGKQKLNLWHVLQGLVAVLATVLAALWLSSAIEARLNKAVGLDNNLRMVFARLTKALLILLAVLIVLPQVGIDLTTLSIFGGALGVGLGFGLQKIASNYVSGFIILLDNSIRIGNTITVGTDRGEVTRITTRYTVLRSLGGVEALVPNELLVGSVVQNESYSDPQVRIALPVQVAYDSDLERAMTIMATAAAAQERVLAEPAPAILLREFADSGINLELAFWIADPQNGTGQLRSDINLAIWREFKQAGIQIPFPQREIRILKEAGHE
ncbi:mechanosensitive ion channel family protein [Sulfuritalea sp.]|uniref:mechanosensitive ion channel family protein n=1 Tax=Sulfuritalea sp. TaxID=2480090 RepID=UPI00286D9BAB|nr:mechanosensitive ion channel domain-containing protein [Sulfuritalea sp.]